jgi:hypothetical protein
MKKMYRRLLALYPSHIRTTYGAEMASAFDANLDRSPSSWSRFRFYAVSIAALVLDATVERLWMFGSHPSFSGRRPPDLGVVRPPNMGKREWFDAAPRSSRPDRAIEGPPDAT